MRLFTNAASAALVAVAFAGASSTARADFSGQTILGPLTLNSTASGDNSSSSDDNDGWFSGDHIFYVWDGGDDVWQLDWPGGDMMVRMTYDNVACDPDLFLYVPGSLDESSYDSYFNTGLDQISVSGAAAGTYYVLVDSAAGTEGEYRLEIIPAPGAIAVGAGAGVMLLRRRR